MQTFLLEELNDSHFYDKVIPTLFYQPPQKCNVK